METIRYYEARKLYFEDCVVFENLCIEIANKHSKIKTTKLDKAINIIIKTNHSSSHYSIKISKLKQYAQIRHFLAHSKGHLKLNNNWEAELKDLKKFNNKLKVMLK